MTGFLNAVAAGAALCGAWVFWRGCGPARLRRLLTGATLVAAAGLCLWLSRGGSLGLPRALVVAYTDQLSAEDLAAVAAGLDDSASVAWLRLTPGEPGDAPARWESAANCRRREGEGGDDYLARIRGRSQGCRANPEGWLAELLEAQSALREGFAARSSADFYRDGLLIVCDRGSTWASLSPRGIDLAEAVAGLARRDTEAFVLHAPSQDRPGRLEIDVQDTLPAGPVAGLASSRASLRWVGAESVRGRGNRYDLRVWLDGGPGEDRPHFFTRKSVLDEDPAAPHLHRLALDELLPTPAGSPAELPPGLHRLHARLVVGVQRNGTRVELEYEATRYVRFERRGLAVVEPDGSLGPLAQETWGDAEPASAKARLCEFLSNRLLPGVGQSGRTTLSAGDVKLVRDPKAAGDELRHSRALVLVEPTYERLMGLDAALDLDRRIRDGLAVLVVVPPVRPAGAPWPAWLPWAAAPKEGGEARVVHRDARLYFCPDSSRLMKFPAWKGLESGSSGGGTGLSYQKKVIEALGGAALLFPDKPDLDVWLAGDGKVKHAHSSAEGGGRGPPGIHPPQTVRLAQGSADELDEQPVWFWETAPSFIPGRLHALRSPPEALRKRGYRPLARGDLYPGSVVVLFAVDLPQPRDLVRAAGLRERLRWVTGAGPELPGDPAPKEDLAAVADLTRQGVTVYVVPIHLKATHRPALEKTFGGIAYSHPDDYLEPIREGRDLAPYLVRLGRGIDLSGDDATADASAGEAAEALLGRLKDRSPGVLKRERSGRVIDDRPADARRDAPSRHVLLRLVEPWAATRPPDLEPDHAVILESPPLPGLPEARTTAVAARPIGEGHVVVTAYSPFAADVWRADGDAAPKPDGWGVQRLLDLLERTTPGAALLGKHPVVRAVREAEGGAAAEIDCWAALPDGRWPEPRLLDAGGRPVPVRAASADPATGRITFRVRNTGPREMHGLHHLCFGEGLDETRTPIWLRLGVASEAGRSAREAAARLAAFSGGGVVGAADGAGLRYRRPVSWFVGLALVSAVLLLLSPAVRPWHSFRRRGRGGVAGAGDRRPAAHFDVETVLSEWGLHTGSPKAGRQAGTPGGEKPYEGGDSLAAARPATLFAFTGAGRSVLPARRPTVRLRHTSRSMEVVVVVDCTRSLLFPAGPHGKAELLELVVRLLVGAVWRMSGTVEVSSVQRPDVVWGPQGEGGEAEDLLRFLREELRRGPALPPGRLTPARALEAGGVLFVVSDLLAPREAELVELAAYCEREGVRLRVAHVGDPPGSQVAGLARSMLTGALVDRSEWTADEVAAAYRARVAGLKDLVEGGGGVFATFDGGLTAGDLLAQMDRQGFLGGEEGGRA